MLLGSLLKIKKYPIDCSFLNIVKSIIKVIAPGKAGSNNFYNENSLFTLCTVLTPTLDNFAVFRTE